MLFGKNAYADVYSECVYSWEFGNNDKVLVVTRPVGKICYNRCRNECSSFLRSKNDGVEVDIFSVAGDLNGDIFEGCMSACQKGEYFSHKYRELKPTGDFVWKPAITTKVACAQYGTQSVAVANYNYYSSGIELKQGDEMVITLADSPSAGGNRIYTCGFKTIKLEPTFRSYDDDDPGWQNALGWHAKNKALISTGMSISHKDYLEITYSGNLVRRVPVYTKCDASADTLIAYVQSQGSWGTKYDPLGYIPGQSLEIKDFIPRFNQKGELEKIDEVIEKGTNEKFIGLSGKAWYEKRLMDRKMDEFAKKYPDYVKCVVDENNYGDGKRRERWKKHVFSGFINDPNLLQQNDNILFLRHANDSASPVAKYSGSIDVSVSWRGCPIEKGQGLQYAIVHKNTVKDIYEPENAKWHNVQASILDGQTTLTPIFEQQDKKGVLFFRVDPTQVQGACGAKGCVFHNMAGSYAVMAVKKDKGDTVFKPVSQIVNRIYNYFFKYDSKDRADGVVKKVFDRLIKDKNFIEIIQTTLVIYMTLSAASFVIGVANLNKQELANRLIKTSIVVALISEKSWEFFNGAFFNFFTIGSAEIIARILGGASVFDYNQIDIARDGPGAIFSVFDQPFKELFGRATWIKISALILSNLFSLIIALVVIASAAIFVVCMGRAMMLYITSLIGIGILLMLSPIFITLMLFGYTKSIFDSWIKQLISFMMQPIFVFVSIAIFIRPAA